MEKTYGTHQQMPEAGFQIIRDQETAFRLDDAFLLFFGLRGVTQIHVENEAYSLSPDGILAVNPGRIYRVSALGASAVILRISSAACRTAGTGSSLKNKCYTPGTAAIPAHLNSDTDGKQKTGDFKRLRELYAVLFYEYLQNHNKVSMSPNGSLSALLWHLDTQFGFLRGTRTIRQETSEKTARFLKYIDAHWNEDLSLSALAQEAHFSTSYLSRFFLKTIGIHFAAYLRMVRLIHSRLMLLGESASVTQIAYDCGFRSPSMYIEAFRQEYGMTPGQFRAAHANDERQLPVMNDEVYDQRSDLSVLLDHMPERNDEELQIRNETVIVDYSPEKCIEKDMKSNENRSQECRKKAAGSLNENRDAGRNMPEDRNGPDSRLLNIGYARDGLLANVRDQIRQAQAQIGFRYFRCHGLLDEDMHIYQEDTDGNPRFSFSYVDDLFDFVTGLGMTPFVELGFMPSQIAVSQNRIFDRPSVISGCASFQKWEALITALIKHLAQRYGIEALRTWRFATISLSYVRIGCLTREEFARLYERTYRAVKEIDPFLQFGGAGYFPDLIENEQIGVPWFLRYTSELDCLPDFHSMQWYPCIQTDDSLFMEYTLSQNAAPALLSRDPDYLKERMDSLLHLFEQYQVQDRELFLEECNSTLWQRDLSGDTCYKAVWLAKNTLLCGSRAVFGYWLLTDFIEERAGIQSLFHGGYGLFTYNGIPKAGYQALRILSRLGSRVVDEGDGWILTDSGDQREPLTRAEADCCSLQLLVYNYSHYTDLNCYRYKRLNTPADAYSVFLPGEKMQMRFLLSGLPDGKCRITRSVLNREHGSAFDQWLLLQAPPYPTREEIRYLRDNSDPAVHMEIVPCSENLALDVTLMPLEMELICLTFSM